ncbi:MAG TPA: hypothetical protein VMY37_09975 [Thermoguttaceae bacterium]|nr:hypothetical protein [Thermoguttaceae bacterium]
MVIRRESAPSVVALAVIALLAGAGPTSAAVLVDGNSSVEIKPDPTSAGVLRWEVDGVNHLDYSWLWYGGGLLPQEYSLDSVYDSHTVHDDDNDGNPERLEAKYQYGLVEITLSYLLTGGPAGSGRATLEGTMTLTNDSTSPLNANLFALFDFDLNGTAADETVERLGAQWMRQTDGNTVVDVLVDTAPSAWEIAESPAIYNKLTDGDVDNLANAGSFASDAEFAWQWNAIIPASGSMTVGLGEATITTTPEPASLIIWTLLSAALGIAGWRRRSKAS